MKHFKKDKHQIEHKGIQYPRSYPKKKIKKGCKMHP